MKEIRGIWISNFDVSPVLTSKQNIAEAMNFLKRLEFNVVFPVAWNKGYTLFPSQVMRDNFNVDVTVMYFLTTKSSAKPLNGSAEYYREIGCPWLHEPSIFAICPVCGESLVSSLMSVTRSKNHHN